MAGQDMRSKRLGSRRFFSLRHFMIWFLSIPATSKIFPRTNQQLSVLWIPTPSMPLDFSSRAPNIFSSSFILSIYSYSPSAVTTCQFMNIWVLILLPPKLYSIWAVKFMQHCLLLLRCLYVYAEYIWSRSRQKTDSEVLWWNSRPAQVRGRFSSENFWRNVETWAVVTTFPGIAQVCEHTLEFFS